MTLRQNSTNRERINVLFVIVQLEMMGGSESLLRSLIKNLDRQRFNPSIAWFYGGVPLQEFVDLDIPLYRVPKTRRIDLKTMHKLSEIIRKENIDVVNAHHFLSMVYAFYGCKMRNHRGLIYTEHSEWEIDSVSWKWKKMGGYFLHRLDKSIGVGGNVTRKLRSEFGIPADKVMTISNGVDVDLFHDNRNTSLSRRHLGLDSEARIIGIVANFREVKNHMFLLQAFKELSDAEEEAKLVLVGKEPDGEPDNTLPKVRRFIEDQNLSGRVHLLGYRSDIPDLLKLMDVFCLTSLKEGLPIGLIEAMAGGLPVIGTNVEGIRDVIADGENGYLVDLNDINGMVQALKALISDEGLRKRMGEQSRKIARSEYALAHCVDKYENEFIAACV